MSTGNFTSWTGNISEIGELYPFVGTEGLLVIVGFVFWIGWHVLQSRVEKSEVEQSISHKKNAS